MKSRNNLRTVKSLFTSVVLLFTILSNWLMEIESKKFAITEKSYEEHLFKPIPRYVAIAPPIGGFKKMICPPGQIIDSQGRCVKPFERCNWIKYRSPDLLMNAPTMMRSTRHAKFPREMSLLVCYYAKNPLAVWGWTNKLCRERQL